jgi:AcrR family transcriptional regulator
MVFVSTPLPPRPGRRSRITELPREPLSRERIVDAAMATLDAGGLDALSMRSVAQALGTGPASLYAHVANKEELLELLIERVAATLELPEPDAEHWQEQVKDMVRAVHYGLLAHRDLARASLATIPLGEGALRFSERMIEILKLGGLPDQVVAYGVDLLPLYAVATAYEHALNAERMATEEGERYIAELGEYFAALPADRFPNIVAMSGPLTAGGMEGERFEFGLDVLLAGLAAYGRRASSA